MIWSRETARLSARVDALEADQRAVRDELAWIRETALPDVVREHDDAVAALQRVLDARTGHLV